MHVRIKWDETTDLHRKRVFAFSYTYKCTKALESTVAMKLVRLASRFAASDVIGLMDFRIDWHETGSIV